MPWNRVLVLATCSTFSAIHIAADTDDACTTPGSMIIEDQVNFLTLTTEVRVRGKRHAATEARAENVESSSSDHNAEVAIETKLDTPSEDAARSDTLRSPSAVPLVTPLESQGRASVNQEDREANKRRSLKASYDERPMVAHIELSVPVGPFCVLMVVIILLGVGITMLLHQQGLSINGHGGSCQGLLQVDTNKLQAAVDTNLFLRYLSRNGQSLTGASDDIKLAGPDKKEMDDLSDDGSDCPRREVLSEDEPECEVDVA